MTAIGIGVNGTSLHEDSNVGMEIRTMRKAKFGIRFLPNFPKVY